MRETGKKRRKKKQAASGRKLPASEKAFLLASKKIKSLYRAYSVDARIQAVERRLDGIERTMLTPSRLKDELAKGDAESDYS